MIIRNFTFTSLARLFYCSCVPSSGGGRRRTKGGGDVGVSAFTRSRLLFASRFVPLKQDIIKNYVIFADVARFAFRRGPVGIDRVKLCAGEKRNGSGIMFIASTTAALRFVSFRLTIITSLFTGIRDIVGTRSRSPHWGELERNGDAFPGCSFSWKLQAKYVYSVHKHFILLYCS